MPESAPLWFIFFQGYSCSFLEMYHKTNAKFTVQMYSKIANDLHHHQRGMLNKISGHSNVSFVKFVSFVILFQNYAFSVEIQKKE